MFTKPLWLLAAQSSSPTQSQICPSSSPTFPPSLGSSQPAQTQTINHDWCTFEAFDPYTSYVENIYLAAVIVVTIYVFANYCRLVRYRAGKYSGYFGDAYVVVYWLVIVWAIITLARVILNIVVYYSYMHNDFKTSPIPQKPDPQISSPLVVSALMFQIFDFSAGFVINLLCIIIPHQFFKVVLLNINQSQLMTFDSINKFGRWFKLLTGVGYYCKFLRNLYILFIAIQPVLFYATEFGRCEWPLYNFFFIIIQSLFIVVFYLFVLIKTLYLRKSQLLRIQTRQVMSVSFKFVMFLIVIVGRIGINIFYIIFLQPSKQDYQIGYKPNGNCSNTNPNNQLLIVLALHHLTMHLAPILMVLYIYRVKSPFKSKSLLKSQHEVGLPGRTSNSMLESDIAYNSIRSRFYKAGLDPKIDEVKSSKKKVGDQLFLS